MNKEIKQKKIYWFFFNFKIIAPGGAPPKPAQPAAPAKPTSPPPTTTTAPLAKSTEVVAKDEDEEDFDAYDKKQSEQAPAAEKPAEPTPAPASNGMLFCVLCFVLNEKRKRKYDEQQGTFTLASQ